MSLAQKQKLSRLNKRVSRGLFAGIKTGQADYQNQ